MINLLEWIRLILADARNQIVAEIVLSAAGLVLIPFPWAWRYYDRLLGYADAAPGTRERRRFDALRDAVKRDLAAGGALAIYKRLLDSILTKLDSFFGDEPGGANPNFGTRLFGLAPAY